MESATSEWLRLDPSGKLVYTKDAKGNRLPDFSHVGYHSGEKAIPDVPVRMTLVPAEEDDTARIQDALDGLGALPTDEDGFRGALLLKRGVYRVKGRLVISHSGVVLRGEGNGPDGTVIIATGYDSREYQRALITVAPRSDSAQTHTVHGIHTVPTGVVTNSRQEIVDEYVPVGSHSFSVKSAADHKPRDRIVVHRPSTQDWIHSISCDQLKSRWGEVRNVLWVKEGEAPGFYYERPNSYSKYQILLKPGESWENFEKRIPLSEDGKRFDFTRQWEAGRYDLYFERKIVAVEGNRITIDAPIVHSMENEYGGGAIYHYETPGRVMEVGIENLRLISEFAPPTPGHPYGDPAKTRTAEQHAWNGIKLDRNTENTWVRNVTGNYFGWSLVSASGKRATVQDCVNLGHASKITGGRRYSFMIDGQLNLMQRCVAFDGRHEFVNQARVAGPNAFVDCIGLRSRQHAGPHHRYAVGNLYDNVKSEKKMESRFRGNSGTGHGWAGTQTCFYNCVAPGFLVAAPPGGISWVIGCGKSDEEGTRVSPDSLYYQQVQDRLGKDALERLATVEQREHLGEYLWVAARLKNEGKRDSMKKAITHPAERRAFEQASKTTWQKVFSDSCTDDWKKNWFLDGEIGTVRTEPGGMTLTAGPEFKNDSHHMVLWTKESFEGDLKIEYDYTRLDSETRCVTILYIQATGSGKAPYAKDISKWNDLRKVPSMKTYFHHMNAYHISYAALPNRGEDRAQYIRGRRYMPEEKGLKGTGLEPDYYPEGLFATGVKHHITVIKKDGDLLMRIENPDQIYYCRMTSPKLPLITGGRIGLRHMYTRSARYKNMRISVHAK